MKPSWLAISLLAVAIATTSCSRDEPQPQPQAQAKAPAPAASQSTPAAQGATAPAPAGVQGAAGPVQALPDFAAIAEANKMAVVNITATANASPRQMQAPFGQGQG